MALTPTQLNNELNEQVSLLNARVQKLSNYLEDWANLPAAVKTGVKAATNARIDTTITQLTALKTEIDAQ